MHHEVYGVFMKKAWFLFLTIMLLCIVIANVFVGCNLRIELPDGDEIDVELKPKQDLTPSPNPNVIEPGDETPPTPPQDATPSQDQTPLTQEEQLKLTMAEYQVGYTTEDNYYSWNDLIADGSIVLSNEDKTLRIVDVKEKGKGVFVLADSINYIDNQAFREQPITAFYCTPNTTLRIVCNSFFFNCYYLETLFIPQTLVNYPDNGEFIEACKSLKYVVVDSENPVLDSRNECNAIIETATNELRLGCAGTTIPEEVTTIGPFAFCGAGLYFYEIPEGITTLKEGAFYACYNLVQLTLPSTLTTIEWNAFGYCVKLVEVINKSSLDFMTAGYENSEQIDTDYDPIVHAPNDTGNLVVEYEITEDNFIIVHVSEDINTQSILLGYIGVKENVVLPEGVEYIVDNAFAGFTEIKSVVIPGCYYSVPRACFLECDNLVDVDIKDGVQYIATCAFYGCDSLEAIDIPNSVDEVSTEVFARCTALKTVHLSEHNESGSHAGAILSHTFYECKGLTSITLHINTWWLGEHAFLGCSNLTDVYYEGTLEQFAAIQINGTDTYTFIIHCTNGDRTWDGTII